MVGIILCGHAHFATGLYSFVKLITGEQENFEVIDYEEGMSSETLSARINDSLQKLKSMDGVAILTDMAGGTPFNESVKLAMGKNNIKVISGVNAPVILDSCFKRHLPVEQFIIELINSGREGIKTFEMK